MRSNAVCRGFALVELIAIVIVVALLAVMLALSAGESRRLARLGEDIAKLRQIGAWTGSYAADNSDQFWTFSWKKGQSLSQWPDLNNAPTDLQAGANQAIDILRRVAGRTDIPPIGAWIPHVFYSHLVLEDYLQPAPMPDLTFVSSGDKLRIQWARDPRGYDLCVYPPYTGCGSGGQKRIPYGSSFHLPAAFYDLSPVGSRLAQGPNHNNYVVPANASLGGWPSAGVAFPGDKVQLHDAAAWHFPPRVSHCAFAEMRLPLLFADGAVHVRASSDANPGWQPNSPAIAAPSSYNYTPGPGEPPTPSGIPSELVPAGRFRWTRGGIAGRDFGGPEVCTGQPGCP